MNKIEKIVISLPYVLKLKIENNTLNTKCETLENIIKDELYKSFINKINEPLALERIKKENKNLRKKVKLLKELIKEDNCKKLVNK